MCTVIGDRMLLILPGLGQIATEVGDPDGFSASQNFNYNYNALHPLGRFPGETIRNGDRHRAQPGVFSPNLQHRVEIMKLRPSSRRSRTYEPSFVSPKCSPSLPIFSYVGRQSPHPREH